MKFEVIEKTPGMLGKYPMLAGKLKSKTGDEKIFLNIYLKGPHYVVAGVKTKNDLAPARFFNSFAFEDFKFTGEFKEIYDSTMFFRVKTESAAEKENLMTMLIKRATSIGYGYGKKSKKKFDTSYMSDYQAKTVYSPTSNENINVKYRKFNDYRMDKSRDDFWKKEIENLSKERGMFAGKKTVTKENNIEQVDLLLTDTASTRGIKVRMIVKQGTMYTLQATVDTLAPLSVWMDTYFKTFKPGDTLIGKSPFEDKVQMLLNDLASKDSSKKNAATNSTYEPEYTKEHLAILLPFMEAPAFRGYSVDLRTKMLWNLGGIKDPRVVAYLQKQYPIYADTASMQFAILTALARQKTDAATKVFLTLLKSETPLSNSPSDISGIFNPFYDSLQLARSLFPALFDLTKFAEYKTTIYDLLAELVSKDHLKGPAYADQKKNLLNEALYELKRAKNTEASGSTPPPPDDYGLSGSTDPDEIKRRLERMLANSSSGGSSDYSDYGYGDYYGRSELENYAILLAPFYSDPQTKQFFDKLNENKSMLMRTSLLLLKNKLPVNDTIWNYYAKNEQTRITIYDKLNKAERLDKFPEEYKTQDLFIRALIYGSSYQETIYTPEKDVFAEKEKDSIVFICKKLVKNRYREGYVYFFKKKEGGKTEWTLDYCGVQPTDEKKVSSDSNYQRSSLTIYEDEKIEDKIDDIVEDLQLKGRERAEGGDLSYNYDDNYYGDD